MKNFFNQNLALIISNELTKENSLFFSIFIIHHVFVNLCAVLNITVENQNKTKKKPMCGVINLRFLSLTACSFVRVCKSN